MILFDSFVCHSYQWLLRFFHNNIFLTLLFTFYTCCILRCLVCFVVSCLVSIVVVVL